MPRDLARNLEEMIFAGFFFRFTTTAFVGEPCGKMQFTTDVSTKTNLYKLLTAALESRRLNVRIVYKSVASPCRTSVNS
jgi:hypothetical protein